MRILFQYLASGFGGGFTNFACLLRAMAEEFPQDSIDVVCTTVSAPQELSGLSNLNVHLLAIRKPFELQRLTFEIFEVRGLARKLKADVIWSLNVGPYVRTGIPQVLSLNNSFQVYPWRECARFHPSKPPILAGLRLFFRRSLRCSDAALVQTQLIKQYLAAVPGSPANIQVVPKATEGIHGPSEASPPIEVLAAFKQNHFRFLYVATAEPHKNHATVIAALDSLVKAGSPIQLVLTISPAQAIERAGESARRSLESGHLVCTGWFAKASLRGLYEACDACVMPSLLESLSSSNLEAMAWSKPQIASDCAFAHDLCGDAALYVPPESTTSWAGAMADLSRSSAVREALVERGRERMHAFPKTWRDMGHQVRAFLLECSSKTSSEPK